MPAHTLDVLDAAAPERVRRSAGRAPAVPARRCAVCRAPVVELLCTAEAIGRDLARTRRGIDGFLHDDARAVYRCGSCGSVCRDPLGGDGDDMARYRRCRYRGDALDELCRRGRAELDRDAGRIRASGVVAGARLLEIGSYAGAFLEFAGEAGCRVTGIDINADVVAHCRSRGHDVCGEAFEPHRFEAGEFDGVWILNCFEQLPDHARVLAGAARVLRPGGTLVIRTPNAEFLRLLYARRGGALLRSVASANALLGMPFAKCFSAAALVRAIEAHGLTPARVEGREFSSVPPAPWAPGWRARRLLRVAGYRAASAAAGRPLSPWLEVVARRTGRGEPGSAPRPDPRHPRAGGLRGHPAQDAPRPVGRLPHDAAEHPGTRPEGLARHATETTCAGLGRVTDDTADDGRGASGALATGGLLR